MKFLLPVFLTVLALSLCILLPKLLLLIWSDALRPRGGEAEFVAFSENRDKEPVARIEVYESDGKSWPGILLTQGIPGSDGFARMETPFELSNGKKFVVLYRSARGKIIGGYHLSKSGPDGSEPTITEIAAKWESKPTR